MAKQSYLLDEMGLMPEAQALPSSPWSMMTDVQKPDVTQKGVQTKKNKQATNSSTSSVKKDIYAPLDEFSQLVKNAEEQSFLQDQKAGIGELENALAMAQDQKDTQNYDWFVKPLLSLTDAQTGSRMSANFTPSTNPKKDVIGKLSEALQAKRGDYSKQVLDTVGKMKTGTESNSQTNQLMQQLAFMTGMAGGRGAASEKSEYQKKLDTKVGEAAANFMTQGMPIVKNNLLELDDVIAQLEGGDKWTSGPIVGGIPKGLRAGIPGLTQSAYIQDAVARVTQQMLRETLGAQFTEGEGVRLLRTAYDPQATPQENLKRLRRARNAIAEDAQNVIAQAQYADQTGTIKGSPEIAKMTVESEKAPKSKKPAESKAPSKPLDEMTKEELQAYIEANGG